jgi:DNA-binding transcriptional regulator of glucitol operon
VVVRRFVFQPRWILGHFLVVAAALTCIRLADWQLSRAHITEAMQNWGYAFQWPLFSVFSLIGWWRMLRLESIRLDEQEAAEAAESSESSESFEAAEGPDSEAPISKAEARRRARVRPPLTAPILPGASRPQRADPGRETEPAGPEDPEDEQLAAYNRMLARLASQDAARDEAGRR